MDAEHTSNQQQKNKNKHEDAKARKDSSRQKPMTNIMILRAQRKTLDQIIKRRGMTLIASVLDQKTE